MRRLVVLVVAALLATACGDNHEHIDPEDAADPVDAEAIDAGIDAGPPAVGPCLDRPTDLPRPPSGQLPCELLPPGFGA